MPQEATRAVQITVYFKGGGALRVVMIFFPAVVSGTASRDRKKPLTSDQWTRLVSLPVSAFCGAFSLHVGGIKSMTAA